MTGPFLTTSANLSSAWLELFRSTMEPGFVEHFPAVIRVTQLEDGLPSEHLEVRNALDETLRREGKPNVGEVASTIFPYSLWRRSKEDSDLDLYERYMRIWPHLKARSTANRRGTYFQRLIAYGPKECAEPAVNQLQHVTETFRRGNHRRSALIATTFDPTRDHLHSRRLGFPCMQQVAFCKLPDNTLAVTGYYTMQYVFERTYGNLLGLCHLGKFIADTLDLQLSTVMCIANHSERGNPSKQRLQPLLDQLQGMQIT